MYFTLPEYDPMNSLMNNFNKTSNTVEDDVVTNLAFFCAPERDQTDKTKKVIMEKIADNEKMCIWPSYYNRNDISDKEISYGIYVR